ASAAERDAFSEGLGALGRLGEAGLLLRAVEAAIAPAASRAALPPPLRRPTRAGIVAAAVAPSPPARLVRRVAAGSPAPGPALRAAGPAPSVAATSPATGVPMRPVLTLGSGAVVVAGHGAGFVVGTGAHVRDLAARRRHHTNEERNHGQQA